MKVGIDAHSIGCGKSGNETYFRSLLRGLRSLERPNKYVVYGTHPERLREMDLDHKRFAIRRVRPSTPFVRIPLAMPAQVFQEGLDLFHAQHIIPPFLKCRTVTTIPDLAYEHYPEYFPPFQVAWSKRLIRWSAQRANHIITVSHFSKTDLMNCYGIDPERITVTYESAEDRYHPRDHGQAREHIARRYGIERPFVLYVGRLQGRKNLVRLIEAYAQVRKRGAEHLLVLVGRKEWMAEEISTRIAQLGIKDEVVLTGYVAGEDLPWFYNASEVFAYPSLFEGFGLPVMEAMACGTPVLTSTGSSLGEIASGAALVVDPTDGVAITDALEQILSDQALRYRLGQLGIKRSREFEEGRMASETVSVYEKVLGSVVGVACKHETLRVN